MGEWARECGLKRSFGSLRDTAAFIKEKQITELHGYKCSHCGMYHLGHPKVYTESHDAPTSSTTNGAVVHAQQGS